MNVGLIGLGAMGGAIAARLLDEGVGLTVYNRTTARADELAGRGVTVAGTPAGAASGADTVLVCLSDEDAVESVVFGRDGIVDGLTKGGVVADLSTVSPAYARRTAERLDLTGHRAVEACVLGSPRHARTGELGFLVGGEQRDVVAVTPVLRHLGPDLRHVGTSGMGAVAKLSLQLVKGVQLQGLAEAIVYGERAGLDRDVLIGLITGSGFSSPVMKVRGAMMARRGFAQRPNFRLTLMRKDLGLVLEECRRIGIPAPATSASHEVLTGAVNHGLGELDCAAVLAYVESIGGLAGYPWPTGTDT